MPVSDPPRKRKPQKKAKNTKSSIQGDLTQLDTNCKDLLMKAASLHPYLKNRELVEAGDSEYITDAASILARDVQQCNDRLNEIREMWVPKFDMEDPEHVALGLNIGGQYEEWIDNFLGSVAPNIDRLSELLVDAAKSLEDEGDQPETKEDVSDE